MKSESLTFEHPLARLTLCEFDPTRWWKAGDSPELFLVESSTVGPYMPDLDLIEIQKRLRVEPLEDGRCEFVFQLSQPVNNLYQLLFENHHKNLDVSFAGKEMTLRCKVEDLAENYDYVVNGALHLTRKDYWKERRELVWRVFQRMKEQERCERLETEIQTELADYQHKRNERARLAEENGWSVPILVQNLNSGYREILDSKFRLWERFLDSATIRKYRALFELEFLAV